MCTTREDLEVFGFTARCLGSISLLKETASQAHTENCRRRIEEESRDTVKAGRNTKAREVISGHSIREKKETNEVEPRFEDKDIKF